MSAQAVINSLEFARQGGTLRGTIPVAELGRLQDVLWSNDGAVDYTLSGGIDERGKAVLRGTIAGTLWLKCQRCFGALAYPVNLTPQFELVEDESGFVDLAEEADSIDLIKAEPELDVVALIEDEILLGLPMSPMHPLAECEAAPQMAQAEADKPESAFSALAALKKQDLNK
jgi:uncharacterized protein